MRSKDELVNLPIAVILDDELEVLVKEASDEVDMELVQMVVKMRGLEGRFPELMI